VTPNVSRVVAYHHAGHAVFAYLQHVPFGGVCLDAKLHPGETDLAPAVAALIAPDTSPASQRRRARRLIDVCLAGSEAEHLTTSEPLDCPIVCASCTMIDAGALTMAGKRDAPNFRTERRTYVTRILQRRARAVQMVADALLAHRTLTSDDVRELVWRAKQPVEELAAQ